jgi:tRNA (cmo5U34)-methyltransferase
MEQKLEEMSEFFNNRSQVYDERHVGAIDGGLESKRILASFLPGHTQNLVDLGIGTGLELEAVFERFPDIEVTGIDIAEKMLRQLKEKYADKSVILHQCSYFDYDLGDAHYDAALSVMSLHHYNHDEKADLYRRIYKGLKQGGTYIECDYMLSEHEYENPQEQEDFYFAEYGRLKREQRITDEQQYHYDTPCTVSNQKQLLLEAGFSRVSEVWRIKNTVVLAADK